MSDHIEDMKGTPVSEEETALALGFNDVFELRRWETDQGNKIFELESKLRDAENERDHSRWNMMRMKIALEKMEPVIERYLIWGPGDTHPDEKLRKLLIKGIKVVLGKEVDWDHELQGWWEEMEDHKPITHTPLKHPVQDDPF